MISFLPVYHRLTHTARSWAALLAAAGCLLLQSPKWTFPLAAWLTPLFLLYYFRYGSLRRKVLYFLLITWPVTVGAWFDVVPFPLPILVCLALLVTAFSGMVYWLDTQFSKRVTSFVQTLFLPAAFTVLEFWESGGGAGVWGSVANTQATVPALAQLVSVTGLWGLSFLIYWLGPTVIWALQRYRTERPYQTGLLVFTVFLCAAFFYGVLRSQPFFQSANPGKTIRIGGVTVSSFPLLEATQQDLTGQPLHLPPTVSPASGELQQANRGLLAFVARPNANRFRRSRQVLRQTHDRLFALSRQAVQDGAQLVMWSEAAALVFRPDEPALVKRGQRFAARNKIYLLMTVAAIQPEKLTPGGNWMANKTYLVDPAGRLVNVFRKNHPVAGNEQSTRGSGAIPAIDTPYGRLGISICYDADFPATMRQLSRQRIGLLLLPSGDWHAISPYHSFMAILRGVENGCSVARQTRGGLSVFTDYRGRQWASKDFFDGRQQLTVTNLPVQSVDTLYGRYGDWLAYGCVAFLILTLIYWLSTTIRAFQARRFYPFNAACAPAATPVVDGKTSN